MRAVFQARSERARVSSCSSEPKVDSAGAGARWASLGAARWRIWAPIFMRALATALALIGLAGIGMAASRSPALSGLAEAPASLALARLGGPELPGLGASEVPPTDPSAPPAPPGDPPRVAPAGSPAPDPCPKLVTTPATASAAKPEPAERGVLADGRVVLNIASESELRRLPGVGAKRAQAIVQLRKRLGRFRRASDLLRIKGIGRRTLMRLLPLVVVDAP